MRISRRRILVLAAGAAALPAVRLARAQAYPTRPIHLVVGFGPGTGLDLYARLIGQWLSERLGQAVVIDNRPGAGTNIATETVVNAPPDGYTLLMANTAAFTNAALYDNLRFNFIRDIAPVASLSRGAFVMVVSPSFPAKTVAEFIAHAKANPGKINMASAPPTTSPRSCSNRWPASTWCTCPIVRMAPPSPISWADGSRSISWRSPARSS
jgi:tripartite-type tricarboxylate transporter receptor subunit TctC